MLRLRKYRRNNFFGIYSNFTSPSSSNLLYLFPNIKDNVEHSKTIQSHCVLTIVRIVGFGPFLPCWQKILLIVSHVNMYSAVTQLSCLYIYCISCHNLFFFYGKFAAFVPVCLFLGHVICNQNIISSRLPFSFFFFILSNLFCHLL